MKWCKVLFVTITALCLLVPALLYAQVDPVRKFDVVNKLQHPATETGSQQLISNQSPDISNGVDTAWVRTYNGPGNKDDRAYSLAVDGQGNVYVTGYSYGSGTYYDYATIKYNSAGVQEWVQRYNGPGNSDDWANSLAVDGQDNVYVTGYSYGSGTYYDYATIKYNSAGVQQWVARYNGPGNGRDCASSLAVDGQGNVYVTGYSYGSGTNHDYATIKYNSAGVQQWVARYNGPGNGGDYASSLAVDGQGNVYVIGESWGSGTGPDYATIKYNSVGVQQWVARYNGPGNGGDHASSLAVDGQGNVYVTGISASISVSPYNYDYATIKYNSVGVEQWVQRYNGPGNDWDWALSLAVDGQGNVYVTGYSLGSGSNHDYATIKYNSAGVQQWVQRYNGLANSWDQANSLAIDEQANVYVTGYSWDSRTSYDCATIKYNTLGVKQWVARYNGPENRSDTARRLAVDGQGNVYVTGASYYSGTDYDYATIKYEQNPVTVEENEVSPRSFLLEQNYPNPFNPVTTLNYQLPHNSNVTLRIYDVLGQEIKTLVDEIQEPGYKQIEWNASTVASGIYFYRIEATSVSDPNKLLTQVKKMLLMK